MSENPEENVTESKSVVKKKSSYFFGFGGGSSKTKGNKSTTNMAKSSASLEEGEAKEENKDDDGENQAEGGDGINASPIKFKRKKKRLKGLASSYFSAYKDLTYKSRFAVSCLKFCKY